MRTRFHQRPNRSEGPCVSTKTPGVMTRKVPLAYSHAEEYAGSLTAIGMTALDGNGLKFTSYEIISPGFMVISSVFTPRAFNSFWKASGVPVSTGNVA
jgi:hypothetical protein